MEMSKHNYGFYIANLFELLLNIYLATFLVNNIKFVLLKSVSNFGDSDRIWGKNTMSLHFQMGNTLVIYNKLTKVHTAHIQLLIVNVPAMCY